MTRVLSGVVLGAVALALIWFLDSTALLGVALAVAALAFHEYERIVERIGARVPYLTALLTTLFACAMVPFQWVDIESVLAASLLLVALNVLASDRAGPALARRYGGGHARTGLHRLAVRQPGWRARDRGPGSGAAVDRDRGGE